MFDKIKLPEDFDFIIIGSGLTEALLALRLVSNNKSVLIAEPTENFGGALKCFDTQKHQSEPFQFYTDKKWQERANTFIVSFENDSEYYRVIEQRGNPLTTDFLPVSVPVRCLTHSLDNYDRLKHYVSYLPVSNLFVHLEGKGLVALPTTHQQLAASTAFSETAKYTLGKLLLQPVVEMKYRKASTSRSQITETVEKCKDLAVFLGPLVSTYFATETQTLSFLQCLQTFSVPNKFLGTAKTTCAFLYQKHSNSELVQGILRMVSLKGGVVLKNFVVSSAHKTDNKWKLPLAEGSVVEATNLVVNTSHLRDAVRRSADVLCVNFVVKEKLICSENAVEMILCETEEFVGKLLQLSYCSGRVEKDSFLYQTLLYCKVGLEIETVNSSFKRWLEKSFCLFENSFASYFAYVPFEFCLEKTNRFSCLDGFCSVNDIPVKLFSGKEGWLEEFYTCAFEEMDSIFRSFGLKDKSTDDNETNITKKLKQINL